MPEVAPIAGPERSPADNLSLTSSEMAERLLLQHISKVGVNALLTILIPKAERERE
jgi:hypothetical protein